MNAFYFLELKSTAKFEKNFWYLAGYLYTLSIFPPMLISV